MIIEKSLNKKYSYILLFSLVLLLGLNITYSVIFQKDSLNTFNTEKYIDLIDQEIFKNVETISIHNKFGDFKIKKEPYSWKLISPKEFPAKNEDFNRFLEELKNLKIIKTYANDEINRSSFRLNAPQVQITIESLADVVINVGLINPVDNSAYIHIKGLNQIYQISGPKTFFETYDFSDLVNSKVFNIPLSLIETFKLFRYNLAKPTLNLTLKKGEWIDFRGKFLDSRKVKDFLLKLISMNTFIILDNLNEQQKELVNKYTKRRRNKIILGTKQGEIEFIVTPIIRKGKKLKLRDNQVFLVKASNLNFYFVINKSLINVFDTTRSKLKKSNINKIFY